ncbi:hypothetical protein PFISCL1PPCAC_11200 [Pristionchus fissidentatus]|uniref:Uncharacterized protein n=1 Tax=Pristionchus fissidentatus TaxID=1538716 RepID=A0AAV5VNI8_9BILA|nr:hypothetical protein PFISCL1PPCAC_11200 [Pristionchus fissidentatus]
MNDYFRQMEGTEENEFVNIEDPDEMQEWQENRNELLIDDVACEVEVLDHSDMHFPTAHPGTEENRELRDAQASTSYSFGTSSGRAKTMNWLANDDGAVGERQKENWMDEEFMEKVDRLVNPSKKTRISRTPLSQQSQLNQPTRVSRLTPRPSDASGVNPTRNATGNEPSGPRKRKADIQPQFRPPKVVLDPPRVGRSTSERGMIDDWRRALEQQSVHFEQWSGTLSQLDVVLRSHVDFLERQEQRAAEAHEELLTTLRALRSDSRRRERDDGNGHGYGEEWGNDDDFGGNDYLSQNMFSDSNSSHYRSKE